MGNRGYVYILVNPAFTGFVKIGKTINDPEDRARQLSVGSGVPAPYAVAWDALVNNCDYVERLIHQQLAESRSRKDREFFAIPLKKAIAIASCVVRPFLCEAEEHLSFQAKETPSVVADSISDEVNLEFTKRIEVAKDSDGRTTVFTNRGTGRTVPLYMYGRPNTFTLALAEKLASTGLTEAEYVHIAQKFGTSVKRFNAYIRYFRQEGFNIVLENGRYVQRK